jgi:hypothetical protein
VIAREVNAERADHRPHTGQLATSLQIASPNLQSPDCQQYGSPLWSGLRRNRPPSSRSSAASQSTTFAGPSREGKERQAALQVGFTDFCDIFG